MIDKLIDPISNILDKFVADADTRNKIDYEIKTLVARQQHEAQMGQIQINAAASDHPSIFVAGARPALLWICTISFGLNYLVLPTAVLVAQLTGSTITLEPLNMAEIMPILMGMLGLGTMRTVEKLNKVERNTWKKT